MLVLAVALATFVPALAIAQKEEPLCKIEQPRPPGKGETRCSETLCGPIGDFDYVWGGPGLPVKATTRCITVTVPGVYNLLVTDRATGRGSKCNAVAFIQNCKNQPPDCTGAHAKDDLLWPPNHEMQQVEIEGVTDPEGDPVLITVYGITQDEPLNVEGDGNTCADAVIEDGVASVRRERTGDPNIPGNGRVYTVYFIATDNRGGQCSGSVTLCVPHDMGQRDTCIDDGQNYDSLGACPE